MHDVKIHQYTWGIRHEVLSNIEPLRHEGYQVPGTWNLVRYLVHETSGMSSGNWDIRAVIHDTRYQHVCGMFFRMLVVFLFFLIIALDVMGGRSR